MRKVINLEMFKGTTLTGNTVGFAASCKKIRKKLEHAILKRLADLNGNGIVKASRNANFSTWPATKDAFKCYSASNITIALCYVMLCYCW